MKNTLGGLCRRLLSCSVVVLVPAFAEDPVRLGEIVVTPTRTEAPLEEVGSAVSVITREQIEHSQARSIVEALHNVPGLSVVQSGRPGGQASVFLRGLNSNQTLFLIDGARIGNPLAGLVTLSNFTSDQIERIEIVRGPQSTLYGADALGGVINIITRKGAGPPTGSATLEGGTHNSFRQAGEISGATSKFSGALSISHLDTDNIGVNDDFRNLTAAGSVTYRPLEALMLGATIRYTNAETGVPGPVAVRPANPTERLQDESLFVRLGIEVTVSRRWQQSLFVSENHEELFDRGNPFGLSDSRSDTIQIGWQHIVKLSAKNTLTAGLDWYENRGSYETVGAIPFDESVDNIAGYLQDQVTLFDRLSLTGGARFDDNSRFGSRFTYRGAGVWRFDETGTRIKASVGTGFKAPSLNDLFLSFPSEPPFASFVANPELKPEKSLGWDAGFEQDLFGKKVTIEARYFENDVRDLITFAFVAPNFTQTNVQRARTRGLEVAVTARPLPELTLWASYTWLAEARNLSTQSRLLRRPEQTGSLGANYHFLGRFNVNTDATLVGVRDDIDPVSFATVRNGGYVKWDVAVSADITRNLQLFGRVENLLDERYEEARGFPALGRVFWGGIKAKF